MGFSEMVPPYARTLSLPCARISHSIGPYPARERYGVAVHTWWVVMQTPWRGTFATVIHLIFIFELIFMDAEEF